jgi:hypothetical protein
MTASAAALLSTTMGALSSTGATFSCSSWGGRLDWGARWNHQIVEENRQIKQETSSDWGGRIIGLRRRQDVREQARAIYQKVVLEEPIQLVLRGASVLISHHQLCSVIISHHESSWVIISHHQSSSVIISYHQSSSVIIVIISHHQLSSVIISHH